jgi:rod shape-determining protein MreC
MMRGDGTPESFAERRHLLVFLALVTLGIVLITLGVKSPEDVSLLEKLSLAVTGPVAKVGSSISSGASNAWGAVAATWSARKDLEAAKEELRDLRLSASDRDELSSENARLRRLLELRQRLPPRTVPAAVVDRSDSPDHVIVIDRGASQGVREDAPVVSPDGVVGKVLTVTANLAKVQCIIDPDAGVAVRIGDSGRKVDAVIKDASGGLCRLRYVGADEEVPTGATVVTSGLDQVYPKGLLVGTVELGRAVGEQQEVLIRPAVDFDRLDEVIVLLPAEESGEADGAGRAEAASRSARK